MSSEQIVTVAYQNLFGRAPDAAGLKFFVDRLALGQQTIATIVVNIAQGAQGSDQQTFAAKVNAADLFTKSLDTPQEVAAYKGDVASKAAQVFLNGIDKDKPATQQSVDKAIAVNTTGSSQEPVSGGDTGGGTVVTPGPTGPTGPFVLGKSFEQKDLAPLFPKDDKDPNFSWQWYLVRGNADRSKATFDMNIAGIWAEGYTGSGIRVAINDDGMDLGHRALQKNLLVDLTYNPIPTSEGGKGTAGKDAYKALVERENGNFGGHGTVVGSIVGMAAGDREDFVGVAPDVSLISGLALENMKYIPKLFDYMTTVAKVDVSVNSYGLDPAFSENFVKGAASGHVSSQDKRYLAAIERAGTEGRNKLGTVIEVSAGNERGKDASAAMTGTTNNKFIIAVGAVDHEGKQATYSTGGASVLVSAIGGEDNQTGDNNGHLRGEKDKPYALTAADLSGNNGDNKQEGVAGDFSYNNYGTSYSGPIVGATAALMLQANPYLGFRDVANILAITARHIVNPTDGVPIKGDTVNFGGLTFSNGIGFGVVDISAAVRLAASWTEEARTVANWISAEGVSSDASTDIPDHISGKNRQLNVTAKVTSDVIIERMEFDLGLVGNQSSTLKAVIRSPSGTEVVLFDKPLVGTTTT